ncbi:hypothetical protein [Alkalimonas mucilaginosa]|uniref:Uncharacterized protein n=1 Tax=Alkalimonas mucilaginosa TaxID=3057676 RepID=A0ABU7JGH7_9GAMM|nr:hypothetical protein [Alkalimonas sp. MEB004]MEE2024793.1 hypothetical protein [Alkalimonas sp. MEB004]
MTTKLLMVVCLLLITLLGFYVWLYSLKNTTVQLDNYVKTSGLIVSVTLYQEAIQNQLRSFNSGIAQTSTTAHWKLTVTYSYDVNGDTFFAVKTIMANELTNALVKKVLGKPDVRELQQKMLAYTPGSAIDVYYRSNCSKTSYLPGMGQPVSARQASF